MIIDNGRQVRLIIDGVFDGVAGLSRGKVAFVPNEIGRRPEEACGGTLNGDPIRVRLSREGKGPIYSGLVFEP